MKKELTNIEFDDLINDKSILENMHEVNEVISTIQNLDVPNVIEINNTYKLKILSDKQKEFFLSKLEDISEEYNYSETLEKM
jgi:hypothetical protein